MSTASNVPVLPSRWWAAKLTPGQVVEFEVYGDRMEGRYVDMTGDTLQVRVPIRDQIRSVLGSQANGTAVVSVDGGAARMPAMIWSTGDTVRFRVVGDVEFVQRRQFRRVAMAVPVTVVWTDSVRGTWQRVVTQTVDISLGGLSTASATTVWPSAGESVLLALDLGGEPAQARATVIGKSRDYGLRLQFTDPDDTMIRALSSIPGLTTPLTPRP